MISKMSRRKFLSRTVLLLFSAVAAVAGGKLPQEKETAELAVKRTSRKKADYYRELAG